MQNQSKSKGILLAPFLRSRTGSCHLCSTRGIIKRRLLEDRKWSIWYYGRLVTKGPFRFYRMVRPIALSLCLFRFRGLVYRDYFCNFLVYPWIG